MAMWLQRTWGTLTGRVGRSGRADPLRLPAWLHRTKLKPPGLNHVGSS